MKNTIFSILFVAVAVFLVSCEGGSGNIQGEIKLNLIEHIEGKDLGGTTVKIKGRNETAATDKDGKFTLKNVDAGTYTLTISRDDWDTKEAEVKVEGGKVAELNETLDYSFGIIKGSVIYSDYEGSTYLTARLILRKGTDETIIEIDSTGTFTKTTIVPGEYEATYTAEGYDTVTMTLTVDKNKVLQLEPVSLVVALGDIKGHIALNLIEHIEGKDLGGTTVKIKGRNETAATDKDGKFTLKNIEAGTYTLTISRDDWDTKEVDVNITGGDIAELNETLDYSFGIVKGYIEFPDYKGEEATVIIASEAEGKEEITVQATDIFSFTKLNAGNYKVTVGYGSVSAFFKKTVVKNTLYEEHMTDIGWYNDSDDDGLMDNEDFDLDFPVQAQADLNTEYTSEGKEIVLPRDFITEAIAKTDNGTLVINGEDSGKEAAVVNGDILAIKLTSASKYATQAIANVSVEIKAKDNGINFKKDVKGIYSVVTTSVWIDISAGANHSCGIMLNNKLFCWGHINISPEPDINTPTLISEDEWVAVVSGGFEFTCALTTDEKLNCWGLGYPGLEQTRVNDFSWSKISAGWNHSCGITTNKELYCWGNNDWGQIGDGTNISPSGPIKIGADDWIEVSAGYTYTCAINLKRNLFCWGNNDYGQLGDGTTSNKNSPVKIGNDLWLKISSNGARHSCGIKSDDKIYCWGNNDWGQLGDGTNVSKNLPNKINDDLWSQITTGDGNTCAIKKENRKLYCWGFNRYGQIGDGTTGDSNNKFYPTQITADEWLFIDSGSIHVCGVKATDSKLYCWGANNSGMLGDASDSWRTTPTLVVEPEM